MFRNPLGRRVAYAALCRTRVPFRALASALPASGLPTTTSSLGTADTAQRLSGTYLRLDECIGGDNGPAAAVSAMAARLSNVYRCGGQQTIAVQHLACAICH